MVDRPPRTQGDVYKRQQEARAVTGQPIVTELMNNEHIHLFEDAHVDMIQILSLIHI